ncbi:MAG TPA: hypothetical protein V6D03_13385 [Candidatus Caenarcaniphilales bacterium]
MQQAFFNRLLQLVEQRPQQGKRLLGLGAEALWELWQRIAEVERQERLQQAQRPGRKRQIGGGRKKDAQVLCR